MIYIKRIYVPYQKRDGCRILVDRLWPRGISKRKAKLDFWLKDIAPTDALRTWFGHRPDRWVVFRRRYLAELKKNRQSVAELRRIAKKHRVVTLLFGAKDESRNEAVILAALLRR